MQWQLMGPGTTINLSNGLPYYHGIVMFPSPLLASPLNHATQSISGPLSLGSYTLYAGSVNAGSLTLTTPLTPGNGGYALYSAAGSPQTSPHSVIGSCTLGTNCAVTLSGSAKGGIWGSNPWQPLVVDR